MGLDTVAWGSASSGTRESVERRSYGRRRIRYLTLVSPVRGEVLNLSDGGMCIESAGRMALGCECHFTLSYMGENFRVSGFVKWCRLSRTLQTDDGDSLPIYVAGVAVQPSESADFLQQFL